MSVPLAAPGNSVMADIVLCKMCKIFSISACSYGKWNQLSSCYLSQHVNGFVPCFNRCDWLSFSAWSAVYSTILEFVSAR